MLVTMQTLYMGNTVPVDVEPLEVWQVEEIERGDIIIKNF